MSVARRDVLAFLKGEFSELAANSAVNITIEDSQQGIKAVLDRTFLELGVSYSALATASVDDTLYLASCAVASYFTLARISKALAPKVDIFTEHPSPEKRNSQAFKAVNDLMAHAKREAQGYGYLLRIDGAANMASYGELNLDILEPEPT